MGQGSENRLEAPDRGRSGPDDECGRRNLVTAERRRHAAAEVREGIAFCLSLPLDRLGGSMLYPAPILAATCGEGAVQGRGVLVDLRRHLGDGRTEVGYELLRRILEADRVVVEEGDFLCLHTGLGERVMAAGGRPDPWLATACAVLDGNDSRLLQWIAESGIAAIAADNLAVERAASTANGPAPDGTGPGLPLHEHCLFTLSIPIGTLWYLTELAAWLRAHGRSRFFLTVPALRLPGAAGAPAIPVGTV
jgi:Putative cyclase